ncbi:MAG: hypothetical protein H0W07_00330 [Chloroflexi bacterium]|nr:hypothetical protein [Chloroflexota bacterium]
MNLNADRDYAATIEDLVADSDAIVIGVLKPRSVVDSMSSDDEFHHLAQDFLVEEVLVGSVKVSETIPVLRSIRAEDVCPIVEFDARPLQVGDRYLFFLRLEKDIYVSSGGPQGQYSLDDGVLDAMTDRMPVVEEFDGKTVDAARQMIRASERP